MLKRMVSNLKSRPHVQLNPNSSQPIQALGEEPPWTISEVVTEKKSVFVARAAAVHSIDQAKDYLAALASY